MLPMMWEMWAKPAGSVAAGAVFFWFMFERYMPGQISFYLEKYCQRLLRFLDPYIQIKFQEYSGNRYNRNKAYVNIENYLAVRSSNQGKRLKADNVKENQSLILSLDEHEEVTDEFQGVKLWWAAQTNHHVSQTISLYPVNTERRYYKLSFHKRYRDLIVGSYFDHVMKEGKAIGLKNRQRKLYTNCPSDKWSWYRDNMWAHVAFEHLASFETLAMDPKKKEDIVNDLLTFSRSKEYYSKIGKAWKRGYLLYGPPGTGKSTMIAAMANLLDYDIYDVELTSVKNNTELRELLIETKNKSIVVIEDIDCSLNLTGQRKKAKKKDGDKGEEEKKDPVRELEDEGETKESKVTLSGLLNVIDGLWSCCGEQRLIVFTTNHLEKLDPALIRRGRMDKHIELSYCCFEAFKMLANNYLDIDSHPLYPRIQGLFEETNMVPADVAEHLMSKSAADDPATAGLENLIQALETAREAARMKAEKEAKEKEVKAKEKEAKEMEEPKVKPKKGAKRRKKRW